MKHSFRRGLAVLLAAVLLLSVLPAAFAEEHDCPAAHFTDLPPVGHWAHAAIDWAVENGIVAGVSPTAFGTDEICTRGQLITLLWRLAGSPAPTAESCPFTDVGSSRYYYTAVLWAYENSVTGGVSDSEFGPELKLNRAQIVTFLYAVAGRPATAERSLDFTDVPATSYYHNAVLWAVENGITAGVTKDSFAPGKLCTRAQAVTFLRAAYDRKEGTLVDEAATRLVDLGWSQFVTVRFLEGNSLENTSLCVDGVDVSAAFTPVTDDGSIVKWEITALSPATLTASRNGLTQTVALSGNSDPAAPVLRSNTAPGYVIGHGPMSIWDYYLPNYDRAGQLRVEPAKTTFSLTGETPSDAPAGWSPETEIDENGNGRDVIIMFNQRTQAEKDWFNAIENKRGSVELVQFDEGLNTLNAELSFSLVHDVPHGSNPVNEVLIPLGQTGLSSNGRYYVRVRSTGHDTALIPIHIVNALAPTLKLSGSGTVVPGQNLSFSIENMPYAIQNPTYAAALTGPDGETKQLEMISDWYQIGDSLFLYNTVDNEGVDRNKLVYNGAYTLTVWSNGFKEMSCTFYVTGGEDYVPESKRMPKVDGVTTATYSGGGSGGGGSSGGQKVSADLKFNGDLLINALLLDRLGVDQASATAIVDRWETELAGWDTVSAMDSAKGGFDWSDYINAVNQARSRGEYLCFADYAAANADLEKDTIPHAVKAVLEDNLLGDLQEDGAWIGTRVPVLRLVRLTGNEDGTVDVNTTDRVLEGESVYILTEDADYFTKLSSVNLNGNSADLVSGTDYSLSVSKDEAGKVTAMLLTLNPSTQSLVLGKTNKLTLRAQGYQRASLSFRYEKDLETELSVSTDKDSYARGENVVLTVSGSKGGKDFTAALTGLTVRLPDGSTRKVGPKGYYSSTEYYSVSGNQITIYDANGSLFSQEGSCTVTLTAQYYTDLQSPAFVMTAPAQEPEDPEQPKTLPEVASVEKVSDFFSSYYRVHFTREDAALTAWLNAIQSVTVNGTAYTKTSTSFWNDIAKFKLSNNSSYGGDLCYLDLTADGFDEAGLTTVIVEAEGYDSLRFTVGKQTEDPDPDPDPDPDEGKAFPTAIPSVRYVDQYGTASYYEFSYGSYSPEALEWIGAITGITVGDTVYTQTSSYPYDADTYYLGSSMPLFMVNRSGLGGYPATGTTTYTLTVTATGYKTARMTVAVTNSGYAITAEVTGIQ